MKRDKVAYWVDAVVLAVPLIILSFGIGGYGLFEPHEGHFAGVGREMLLRGDWVTPTLNGSDYLNKPPLLYWLIATSYQVFGVNEFAARLPLALSGWVGVIIAWKWARELWGILASRAAALMLGTTAGWFIFTHQVLIDELLATLILAMVYCLWRLVGQRHRWRYFMALYVLLGLTILAKGLLGIVFFVAAVGAIALSRRSFKVVWQLKPLRGLAVTAAVILPWFIAVEQANPGFLQYLIVNEHLKRAVDTRWPPDYSVSKISPWGYLAVSALWCLPWIVFLPMALVRAWDEWRQGQQKATPEVRQQNEGILLLVVTAALPLVLFLPLSSRLYYYSVPAIAPIIMLCAAWWAVCRHPSYRRQRQILAIVMIVSGVAIGSACLWILRIIVHHFPELASTPSMFPILMVALLGLGLGLLIGGITLWQNRPVLALIVLVIGLATTWTDVAYGFSLIEDFRSSENLIETANRRLGPATLWTFEGSREMGAAGAMSFYLSPYAVPIKAIPGATATQLPIGWVSATSGTAYPVVLVLTDGGQNRLPPEFPGPTPRHWITKQQLQMYWNSDRPVVFVTDFLRQANDPNDPPSLNLPLNAGEPLLVSGPRKLYGNAVAQKQWLR